MFDRTKFVNALWNAGAAGKVTHDAGVVLDRSISSADRDVVSGAIASFVTEVHAAFPFPKGDKGGFIVSTNDASVRKGHIGLNALQCLRAAMNRAELSCSVRIGKDGAVSVEIKDKKPKVEKEEENPRVKALEPLAKLAESDAVMKAAYDAAIAAMRKALKAEQAKAEKAKAEKAKAEKAKAA